MSKIVDVTLRLKDNLSSGFKQAEKNFTSSSRKFTQNGKQIQSAGKAITGVGAKLTAGVTAPIVALGTTSVKNFGDVDKQLRLVQQTMGSTSNVAKDLAPAMKKAASNSVFTMKEAADASLNFARQGRNAKETAQMLAPAMNLAAGTSTDLSEVTNGLGNSLKIFGMKASDATEASNIFMRAQAQANTTTSDLFSAMSTAGPVAASVGWNMKDLAVTTGVFGNAGISGSEGATALKTGLARLASPAKDGATWIKKLGLNIFDSNGKMKSMAEVQSQLHNSFKGLTQQQQLQAASAIFGKNQMAKWMTLINASPKEVQKLSKGLEDQAVTSKKASNALMSGTGGSIEKLKSTFDVFKYSLGQTIAGPVTKFISKLTDMIQKFNEMPASQQKSIAKMLAFAAAIGPGLVIFGKMVTGIGSTVTYLGKFGSAIKKAGGLLKLVTSPAGIVIIVLVAIVTVTILVITHWKQIKKVASNVFGFIKTIVKAVGTAFKAVGKVFVSIGKTIASVFKKIWAVVTTVFAPVIDAVKGYVDGCKKVFSGLIDFITGVFTGNWKKAWEGVKKIFGGVFEALKSLVKAPMNAVISLINKAISGINKLSVKIPDWVPGVGGKKLGFSLPTIPALAKGALSFKGGIAQINERGGEIVDLPHGSRVYPHDQSLKKAYNAGARSGKACIKIDKVADTVIIKNDDDIDSFVQKLADRLEKVSLNMGGAEIGYLY